MKEISKVRNEYKVSIIASATSLLMIPIIFVFVLLPTYGLVGSELSVSEIDKKLESLQSLSMNFNRVVVILIATSILFGAIGLYKDVKARPKRKS